MNSYTSYKAQLKCCNLQETRRIKGVTLHFDHKSKITLSTTIGLTLFEPKC
jgi:hypothetical protein